MNQPIEKQLAEAERRYAVGDYKTARRIANELESDEGLTESQRKRLSQIWRATQTDKVAVMAILFTAFLLLFLVLKYVF